MKKITFIFLAFLLLLSFSCETENIFNPKPPNKLPTETITGEHTFGCLVNGEVWRPYVEGKLIWESALDIILVYGGNINQVQVNATRSFYKEGDFHESISINVWNPVLGENEITPSKGIFTKFGVGGCRYRVDTLSPHIMNIKNLDTINFIVSGTFEFTAINDECQDTFKITNGRFDG